VDEISLQQGSYDLGESVWVRASMIGEAGRAPFFNYTLTFALQRRKSAEYHSLKAGRAFIKPEYDVTHV
jgi:hypothetical protein